MRTGWTGRVRPSRYRALQPWPLAWLTVLWIALWGSASVGNVVLGFAVAVAVSWFFPLPPVDLGSKVRFWPLVWLVVHFIGDVLKASVQVSLVVLRRRPVRNAVVKVDLHSNSDFVLTGVAAMLTLVPGSVVLEARRSTHTLFLHVLDTDDEAAVEKFRAEAFAVEERFLRAFEPLPEFRVDAPTLAAAAAAREEESR
ncbi:Na+/H+ antiporter subunit E [Nocardioides yefusunii]|nr:Na+/H+ antiporter subunit E [Nocardioides yefusunii]